MYSGKYWSAEECRWVDCPEQPVSADLAVPAQRADEPAPAEESVEA
jgi:hypothetical protein